MTMHCEVVGLDQFDQMKGDWTRLALRYRGAPFLGHDFVKVLIKFFATGTERLVKVVSDGELMAIGVFTRRRLAWETFQPSQLPIGCLLTSEGIVWPQLLEAIGRALPGITLGVGVTQQDPLYCRRPADNGAVSTLDYITTAAIDVAGSFDDYWNQRGKNLRQNLRKQRRKLGDDAVVTRLEVLRDAADMAEGVADYGRLENAGWKAGGGTAVSNDNAQGQFYRKALQRLCEQGRGMVCRYRFGEQIVVVDLCIESEDAVVVLKTTYDESIRAFSPAALMREELFRQWWEAGRIKRIEFYGPQMEWHTRWSHQSRTLYHVTWYRWPTLVRAGSRLMARLHPSAAAVEHKPAQLPDQAQSQN